MIKKIFILLTVTVVFSSLLVFGASPVIFFSDLTDGPVSGWEGSSVKGVAVSVWGLNFGTSRGASSITCGGVSLTNSNDYAEWGVINKPGVGEDPNDVYSSARGLERITFWLNSSMTTGATIPITVTVGGVTSSSIPFYCRTLGSNHIYFISRNGSDSNNGLYATQGSGSDGPWKLASKVRTVNAGDAVYFRGDGVWTEEDAWGALICFVNTNHNNGTENNSISLSSYPGEIAELGNKSIGIVIRHLGSQPGDVLNYWTFSKFLMRAASEVTNWGGGYTGSDDNIRFIGNDGSTYAGGGCIFLFDGNAGGQTNLCFYGNNAHDAKVDKRGDVIPSRPRAYPIYFEGYGTHNYIYIGWNEFSYNEWGRGMQFYGHTPGDWIDNLYIHDNYIHHNGCQGAVLGGSDGGGGLFMRKCSFYNNIIFENGHRGYEGIILGGNEGEYYIYNNVFYKNNRGEIDLGYGTLDSAVIKNNIILPISGKDYYSRGAGLGSIITGNYNCYYGAGNGPSWDINSLNNTDPQFAIDSPVTDLDFKLKKSSLCRNAGAPDVTSIVKQDYAGVTRQYLNAVAIGVYEYGDPLLPTLTTISVSPASTTVAVGASQAFTAQGKDQSGNPLNVSWSWSSGNTSVGTIDANGIFTGIGLGSATITASSGAVKGTATVTVFSPPGKPQKLTAVSGGKQVLLDWQAPLQTGGSSIAGYRIYRGSVSGSGTLLDEVGVNLSYTDNSVNINEVYYYQVSAKNTAGEGTKSDEVIVVPLDGLGLEGVAVYPTLYVKGKSSGSKITFSNLPGEATLSIYTVSGELVETVKHTNVSGVGTEEWDVSAVNSGVYIYAIVTEKGSKKGKISVIK